MTTHIRPSRPSRFSAFKAIILCLLAGLFSTAFAEDWDGSTSKPSSKEIDGVEYYVITSPSELAWFAYQVNNKSASKINAVLGSDIHFMDDDSTTSTVSWTAIGFADSTVFDGVFDGAGYKIYGLYSKGAIFGYTGSNFVLRNFSIKKSDVITWVVFNYGLVEDCTEENDGARQISGLVYSNYGTIKNCVSKNFGISFYNTADGLIENCLSQGYAGLYSASFRESSNTFSSVSSGTAFGGIVSSNRGTIRNCSVEHRSGNVLPGYTLGGIAMEANSGGIITGCSFRGVLAVNPPSTGWVRTAGIAAYFNGGEISNTAAYVDSVVVAGSSNRHYIGGIVGDGWQNSSTTPNAGTIRNSYAKISLSHNSKTQMYLGGLAGTTSNTLIENSHAELRIGTGVTAPSGDDTSYVGGLVGYLFGRENGRSQLKDSYGLVISESDAARTTYGGVANRTSFSDLRNCYFDKTVSRPESMLAIPRHASTATQSNVTGKTTAVMQSPAFVETLNTNAGLDDDSGIWQYCEGNYPILVSEGTCEEFYSKYGLSSSSQSSSSSAESSSSTPVESSSSETESSSSQAPASSSSSDVILSSSEESSSSSVAPPSSSSEKQSSSSVMPSSSSAKQESSSSDAKSSSSEKSSSSSAKSSSSEQSSSSSAEQESSSSEEHTTVVMAPSQKTFNLAVNGMTLTLSNTQGGVVRIFDALGHMVAAKPLASATTSITLQTPGNYIVRANGACQMVMLR